MLQRRLTGSKSLTVLCVFESFLFICITIKNYCKLRAGRGSGDQKAASKISLVSCWNDKNNGKEEERAQENARALGRNSVKLMQPKIKCDLHAVPFNLTLL